MSRARDIASGSGIEAGEVLPHIIPGVLYPAVGNIMMDGSTALSASSLRSHMIMDIIVII